MSEIRQITYQRTSIAITTTRTNAAKKAPDTAKLEPPVENKSGSVPSDAVDLNTGTKSADSIYKARDRDSSSSRIGKGFDENFLGEGFKVPLPEITGPAKEKVLKYNNKGDTVRDYTHFSLEMNKDRKMCFYTAHNVDGARLVNGIKRGKWEIDNTIGYENQLGNSIYSHNPLDKGHMVRRIAVAWGDKSEAKRASDDTFNYTNAIPQHGQLNQKKWLDLEDWLLVKADEDDRKLSVFTGPVFREDDKIYRGEKIPADFWKIIVCKRKTDGKLAAAAFMMSQKEMIEPLYKSARGQKDLNLEGVPTEEIALYQVPISTIESLTNLDFGEIKDIDAYSLFKAKQGDAFSIFKSVDTGNFDPKAPIMTEDVGAPARREINSPQDIIL